MRVHVGPPTPRDYWTFVIRVDFGCSAESFRPIEELSSGFVRSNEQVFSFKRTMKTCERW
jgi:hypothetical protein